MRQVKQILVPLDGSPLAETILPVAATWAKAESARITLLRAALPDRPPPRDNSGARSGHPEETYLAEIAARLERCGLTTVSTAVCYDVPARAITEAVRRDEIDLIAMATHGRGGLSRALLGSVADSVVRSVRAPVLLIRGQSAWKPWATNRIMVPLDGSDVAEGIIPVAERLAVSRGLSIVLLQVIEPLAASGSGEVSIALDDLLTVRRHDAEQYLDTIGKPMEGRGLRIERAVRFGPAPEIIAALAIERGANLIAMATHGRRGLSRLFFGSVAAQVLRSASVPVLLATHPLD